MKFYSQGLGPGLLFIVWGLGMALIGWRQAHNEASLRRTSESREKSFWTRGNRKLSRDEWIERDVANQRGILLLAFVPGGVLFVLLGLVWVIQSLVG